LKAKSVAIVWSTTISAKAPRLITRIRQYGIKVAADFPPKPARPISPATSQDQGGRARRVFIYVNEEKARARSGAEAPGRDGTLIGKPH